MTQARTASQRRVRSAIAVVSILGATTWGLGAVPGAAASGPHQQSVTAAAATRLVAGLTGAQEAPDPGDPNGTGRAVVRLRPATHKVCVNATWSRIGRPIGAHIHRGGRGVSGPVVVDLSSAVTGGAHCATAVKSKLIKRIKNHPGNFYFNIHTNAYQGGAIRGQLHR